MKTISTLNTLPSIASLLSSLPAIPQEVKDTAKAVNKVKAENRAFQKALSGKFETAMREATAKRIKMINTLKTLTEGNQAETKPEE